MFLTLVQLVSTFITYITVLYNVHRLGTFSKRYWSIFCWPINGQTWWPSKKYNGVKFSTIREVISFWVSHYQWSWDCSWRSHIWTDSAVLIGYINQWEGRLTRFGSAHKRHILVQTQASFGCTSIYFLVVLFPGEVHDQGLHAVQADSSQHHAAEAGRPRS